MCFVFFSEYVGNVVMLYLLGIIYVVSVGESLMNMDNFVIVYYGYKSENILVVVVRVGKFSV